MKKTSLLQLKYNLMNSGWIPASLLAFSVVHQQLDVFPLQSNVFGRKVLDDVVGTAATR